MVNIMRRTGILAAVLTVALCTATAHAAGYKIQSFEPTHGSSDFFEVYGAYIPDGLNFQVGLWVNYSDGPLTVIDLKRNVVLETMEGQLNLDVGGSLQLYKWVELQVNFPVALYQYGDGIAGLDPLDTTAVGDLRIDAKVNLLSRVGDVFSLALVPSLRVPTSIDYLSGVEGVGVTPHLVSEIEFWRLRLAIDLGYTFQQENQPIELSDVPGDDMISYGGALELEVLEDALYLIGELYGGTDAVYPYRNEATNPLQGHGGARWVHDTGLRLTVGAGGGLLPGVGVPNWRVFLGMAYQSPTKTEPPPPPPPKAVDSDKDGFDDLKDDCPYKAEDRDGYKDDDGCPDPDNDGDGVLDVNDKCRDEAEDKDGFEDEDGCPDPDNDGDGFLDADDKCPLKPESKNGIDDDDGCPEGDEDKDGILDAIDKCPADKEDQDGFEDEDGCPDRDNDKDGIPDKDDKCPLDAEDVDGYEDKDGCPDPDNDKDGVPDKDDKCPDEKEDRDGFEDEDGCPDPDNDKDGIPDTKDKCPLEPEVINGIKDKDGCPDEGKTLVVVTKKKIEIKDRVYFKSGSSRILRKSFNLLRQVAAVLKANTQIKVLEIQGHTDSSGSAKKNKRLSTRRARSVRKFLMRQGIDRDRLIAEGYGEDSPIDDNSTKEGRANNRRVEFVILQQD